MEGPSSLLRATSDACRKVLGRIKTYDALRDQGIASSYQRERELDGIRGLVSALPPGTLSQELLSWVESELEAARADQLEFRRRFGSEFSREVAAAGMRVLGQLPLLRVGWYAVEVEFGLGRAALFWGPQAERLESSLPLSAGGLAGEIRRRRESGLAQAARPEELMPRLRQAYRRHCLSSGAPIGGRVFLIDLLAELCFLNQTKQFRTDPIRPKFTEYPRPRFSLELHLLRTDSSGLAARSGVRLHVANFDATTERARALWVPDNEDGDGTYFSYISFTGE